MIDPDEPSYAGQQHYTQAFLKIYDPLVLGIFTRIWRCPTARVRAHHQRHIRRRHLDVGPGTGYFLDRVQLPDRPLVTLLDPNVHVLAHASQRLSELTPTTVEADILTPLLDLGPFGSVALNSVLHCLPVTMAATAAAIFSAHGPRREGPGGPQDEDRGPPDARSA